MSTPLTADQIAAYQANGFLHPVPVSDAAPATALTAGAEAPVSLYSSPNMQGTQ